MSCALTEDGSRACMHDCYWDMYSDYTGKVERMPLCSEWIDDEEELETMIDNYINRDVER